MVHLIKKETFEAKKRLKPLNILAAVHSKALVLDVKNLSEENSEGKKPVINYLCDLKYNIIDDNKNTNDSYRFLKKSLETAKINFGQLEKCKEINLEHENSENLPEQSNTWWIYEYYFLVFFFLNTFFVYKKILHPISLLPYVLSIPLRFYFALNSPKIYKVFALFVNFLAFTISSVCYLDFIFKFILKNCDYDAVNFPIFSNLSLLCLFLLITLLPRKRFKFSKSYLVIPIFALYSFLVFIYFDFITTIPLVLGLGVMVVINLETDIYSNKYKEDLISNFMMFLVGLGNVLLGLCHCLFSLYFLHSKINFS